MGSQRVRYDWTTFTFRTRFRQQRPKPKNLPFKSSVQGFVDGRLCYQLGKLRKCLFRKKNEGMHWEQREAEKRLRDMENKACRLDKVHHCGPWPKWDLEWKRTEEVSVPTYTPQSHGGQTDGTQHIFKPLFNTVTFFFACLLFIPLVKSSTSCHCLKENVRGLWLPVPLLREGARGPQPAVVLATGQVKQLRGWAPHQNKPTKGVHSQPVPHSHSVQVETQILPKALSLLFPCLLPDIPKRSILFPFQRENKEEVWLPGIQAVWPWKTPFPSLGLSFPAAKWNQPKVFQSPSNSMALDHLPSIRKTALGLSWWSSG